VSNPDDGGASGGSKAPELTPVEEPEAKDTDLKRSSQELVRSPKRQSSTVYEKVCAKLSRSLSSSASLQKENRKPTQGE
jgi:hypothetical protein